MKIECPVTRPGGSVVELWGTEYHFKPEVEGGPHVAEVADPAHQDRFLEIGYKIHRGAGGKPEPKKAGFQVVKPPVELKGSIVHQPEYEIGGKKVALTDVVKAAAARAEMTPEAWNELDDAARADMIDAELDFMAGDVDGDGDGQPDGDAERAAAAAEYLEKFGKKPHHKWSVERIREELAK